MERRAAGQRAGVRDWVDSNFARPQPREQMLPRDAGDLLSGCDVRELDFDVDTIPAELNELFK